MLMPGRKYSVGDSYRYGFNGQEKSTEINENLTTAKYWEYDSRIGRRWNLDPKPTVGISEYSVFNNNPVWYIDILGDTTINGVKSEGANSASATTLTPVVIRSQSRLPAKVLERIKSDSNGANMGHFYLPGAIEADRKARIKFTIKSEANGLNQMLLLSRYQRQNITLVGAAIDLIKNDNAFKNFENRAKAALLAGAQEYESALGGVMLGGERNSFGNLVNFVTSPIIGIVTNYKTIKVATSDLTWMLRHVTINASSSYNNGILTINYHLYDQFDLSPTKGRDGGYNIISKGLGGIYHGAMDNSAPYVDAYFDIEYK
jgi:RHS repeat-associated protein